MWVCESRILDFQTLGSSSVTVSSGGSNGHSLSPDDIIINMKRDVIKKEREII